MEKIEEKLIHDRWQILIKTRLFHGLDTQPTVPQITIPNHIVNIIDRVVLTAVNKSLLEEFGQNTFDNNNDGIQGVEICANRMIQNAIHHPIIRMELYPAEQGLCAVVNVSYNERDIQEWKAKELPRATRYLDYNI